MQLQENNYAFIDSQNLNLSIKRLGWSLDFAKFRTYLKDKYGVEKAFLFIGYMENNKMLYKYLEDSGYILVFKPTLGKVKHHIKGNCDAELVLHTMIQYSNFTRALIVSGDGDFYCLINYLRLQEKLRVIFIPDRNRYSALLRFRENQPYLRFMNDFSQKLGKKGKSP